MLLSRIYIAALLSELPEGKAEQKLMKLSFKEENV